MKNLILTLLLIISYCFIYGFAGDDCAQALQVIDLTGSTCATARASNTNDFAAGSCEAGINETWFYFTAQGYDATVDITTSSSFNPELLIVTSTNGICTGTLSEAACVDDTGPLTLNSSLTGLTIGETYYLLVSSDNNTPLALIDVCVDNPAPAGICLDPFILFDGVTSTHTTGGNTPTFTQASYPCGTSGDELWFVVDVPAGCFNYDITATNTTSGVPGNLNLFTFNTADCINFTTSTDPVCAISPSVSVLGINGPTFFFVLVSGASGNVSFDLDLTGAGPFAAPANDNCATPYTLGAGDGIGNLLSDIHSATLACASNASTISLCSDPSNEDEYIIPTPPGCTIGTHLSAACGGGSVENSVYFDFTVPITGPYRIYIGNQTCSYSDGVQYIITDVLDCNNAQNTGLGVLNETPSAGGGTACNSSSSIGTKVLEVDLTIGTTYYIVADGFAGDQCTFDILITDLSVADPFPIILEYFKGENLGSTNYLSWGTGLEKNEGEFILERSTNELDFLPIYNQNVSGVSGESARYSFTDQSPFTGQNYYRLQMKDLDGSISYSNIVQLRVEAYDEIKVFPNPIVFDVMSIEFQEIQRKAKMEIFDAKGVLVLTRNFEEGGALLQHISTSGLTKGVYVYKIRNGNNVSIGKIAKGL